MSITLDFSGDPHIGVFSRVIHDLAIVPPEAPPSFRTAIHEELGAEVVVTTLQDSSIIGALLTGNRKGMVVSGLSTDRERRVLEEYGEVFPLEGSMTASGNVILATDSFVGVHPDMEPEVIRELGVFLGAPVHRMSLAGIKTVGMAAVATDRGILIHPRSTPQELEELEKESGLPVGRGSVNMGSGLVGTGLLANERGYLAGFESSGYELGRIEEVFGFLE